MPFYASLRREKPEVRTRIAAGLVRLRAEIAKQNVPVRTVEGDVLVASWNIREFDSGKFGGRTTDAFFYIAEILSHFDLIAIQEVREDLGALERVKSLLGGWWKYIVTDVADRKGGGNGERMAFLYDGRKVAFGGLAGEIVLGPHSGVDGKVLQFARTPFVCGFKSGWASFELCTVHIYYGTGAALDPRRLEEIEKLAGFFAERAKKSVTPRAAPSRAATTTATTNAETAERDTLILLGDFNIFDPKDATLKAITDAGFAVPQALVNREGSNIDRSKFYDQIAVWRGRRFDETPRGGVLDYYQAVFRAEDEALYAPAIPAAKSGRKPSYAAWKTYQMSDHLLLWAAFKVDYTDDYLVELTH